MPETSAQGEQATFINRLACVIHADGSIARGYMIESCELTGVNEYIITWKPPFQGGAKPISRQPLAAPCMK